MKPLIRSSTAINDVDIIVVTYPGASEICFVAPYRKKIITY